MPTPTPVSLRACRLVACLALAGVLGMLPGCSVAPPAAPTPSKPGQFETPPQPSDTIRLVVYRPHSWVGAWGKPVILVNGQPMLNPFNESSLEPGSVLIVDAPRDGTRIEWAASKQAPIHPEPIQVQASHGARQYFRWSLKPTYGYLEPVTPATALQEATGLRPAGYKNLLAP